jgi:hypothetical protein
MTPFANRKAQHWRGFPGIFGLKSAPVLGFALFSLGNANLAR